MNPILPTRTGDLPLQSVCSRLQQHKQVEGLMLIGSLAQQSLTPASDYDLVIVLHTSPQPFYVGVTQIDQRFTDLIFVEAAALQSIRDLSVPIAASDSLAPIIRWLKQGQIIFDRNASLQQAQQHVQKEELILPADQQAAYGAYFAINYNLAVAQRLVLSSDSIYHTTALIRMAVYGHSDLWHGYFTIRQIAWDGDKAAVRYLLEHDPVFLETYQQFIAASSIDQKLMAYEQAAALATAALGGLWPAGSTVMNIADAQDIWQEIIGA